LGNIQVLNWASKDGTAIQGLFITPPDYDPKQQYPLYIDIHGGPTSQQEQNRYLGGCDEYSEAFPTTSCPANILGLGYVILQVNYRGSNGYGLDFRLKNFKDFGGGDFQDLLTGIDYLNQKGLINPHKIAIAGWSYGGYLTNWSISQSPIFYKAIDGEGITNFISYTGTSDDTDFFLRYMGSYFWDANQALYWDRSPIAHVKNIHTPLLILEGERDIRVPPSQPQELYTALKLLNQPVKMLLAPNQSHEPTDPGTISQEIKAIDEWLEEPNS
jgi:dipeptidyl aminopeptidase/acylaminoacyl peptidase